MKVAPTTAEQAAYWAEKLTNLPQPLDAILDFARPPVQSFIRASETVTLDPELYSALKSFCAQEQRSLFTVLLTALKIMLLRCAGQQDIVIGTLAPDSKQPGGSPFANPLALRTTVKGLISGSLLLDEVAQVVEQAARHRDYAFAELLDLLGDEALDYAPIFQIMLLLLNQPLPFATTPCTAADLAGAAAAIARCDLVFELSDRDGRLSIRCTYDVDLFAAASVMTLLGRLQVVLAGLLAQPQQPVSILPLLTPFETRQLLLEWNNSAVTYPHTATVPQLFEAQVAQTPDAVAVLFEELHLTYGQLNQRANQLAHYLQQFNIGPETLVGLYVERSLEMVIGLLAILKCGAAYVPLDTAYPPERLSLMLRETQTPLILSQSHLADQLPPHAANLVLLDTITGPLDAASPANLPASATAANLVYVMYTSGSTGRPKGIAALHRGVVRLVKGANYASLKAGQTFLQLAPIAFDASTLEIWGCLLNGGRLLVCPPQNPSLRALAELLDRHRVDLLWLTAGLFHQMVEAHPQSLARVQQLLAGGDVLLAPQVQKILAQLPRGHCLINGYGPTENTTFTCCYPMTNLGQVGETVSIGKPVSNTQVYLLDSQLQLVPPGQPGELYLAGDGLARGYLNQPALTAERFIPNPFGPEAGSRLYKTGDLVRFLPDGNLEFLGRADDQVKIRGFRIELGEIETALVRHSAVGEAVVLAHPSKLGYKFLAAYIVPAAAPGTAGQDARVSYSRRSADLQQDIGRFLRQTLPDYMLPTAVVFLEAMPLTANGKVDRRALPVPEPSRLESAAAYVGPRNPVEEVLANIWSNLLDIDRPGIHADFFALGGHSLLATQLVSRIHTIFRVDLPLHLVFTTPTIAGLAEALPNYEPVPGQVEAVARLHQQISAMSPEEVQAMLQQKRGTNQP